MNKTYGFQDFVYNDSNHNAVTWGGLWWSVWWVWWVLWDLPAEILRGTLAWAHAVHDKKNLWMSVTMLDHQYHLQICFLCTWMTWDWSPVCPCGDLACQTAQWFCLVGIQRDWRGKCTPVAVLLVPNPTWPIIQLGNSIVWRCGACYKFYGTVIGSVW